MAISPEDIDESKLPKWMPRWFVRWVLRVQLERISKAAVCLMVIFGLILLLKIGYDAFGPGYCTVARAILFLPAVVTLGASAFFIFGKLEGVKPNNVGLIVFLALMSNSLLGDLQKEGVNGALNTLLAFVVGYALVYLIPWSTLRRRFAPKQSE